MVAIVEKSVEWMSGRGIRNTGTEPVPVPLCPPQIPHEFTWDWTRAIAVESRRLTTWAKAQPSHVGKIWGFHGGDYEEYRSSKTSVLTRATRRNISENGILHM
jgi:hypothetical protein